MTKQNDNLEIEVKFLLTGVKLMRKKLLALGATVHQPRVFERNVRLDTAVNDLWQQGQLLRLRQDRAAKLTFKAEAETAVPSEAHVREELEVIVDDFQTTLRILERLGFQPSQQYEKYREVFHYGPVEVMLDELPFGDFIELEGAEPDIKQTAVDLGLDWEQRVVTNYLALMAELKKRHQLPFDDLTFANFEDQPYYIADVLT